MTLLLATYHWPHLVTLSEEFLSIKPERVQQQILQEFKVGFVWLIAREKQRNESKKICL